MIYVSVAAFALAGLLATIGTAIHEKYEPQNALERFWQWTRHGNYGLLMCLGVIAFGSLLLAAFGWQWGAISILVALLAGAATIAGNEAINVYYRDRYYEQDEARRKARYKRAGGDD